MRPFMRKGKWLLCLALLVCSYFAGSQRVVAVVGPPCVSCVCKNLNYWDDTNGNWKGAYIVGSTTQNILFGVDPVLVPKDCTGGILGTNGNCDIYSWANPADACTTPPPPANKVEAQAPTGKGTLVSKNTSRMWCQ